MEIEDAPRLSQVYRSRQVSLDKLIAVSPLMKQMFAHAKSLAASDAPILILGETGTGKNLLAQGIHNASRRAAKPYCEVNLGGISETLQEAELFGHTRGAFTGAETDREGLLATAKGGTVFLNEVGDTPLSTQKKLLDVLEYKKFRRLGDNREFETDVRLIGATNRDLAEMRRAGQLRDDFYFRLNVLRIEVPPLRSRPEDIVPLAEFFLKEFSVRECKDVTAIAPGAVDAMRVYGWPGNIRELRYVMWRALVSAKGDTIKKEEILGALEPQQKEKQTRAEFVPLEEVERDYIEKVLGHTNWNKSRAAEVLKISRPALDRKIAAYGLVKPE
ncbi:MAG: sigma-54 dependent transcriptional regulator [Planctomycetota bacterium]|nr:sigma-54 dependent transcriptional regulator [Planctomycetota bacterium]